MVKRLKDCFSRLLVCLALAGIAWAPVACQSSADTPVKDLLLDLSAFPSEWTVEDGPTAITGEDHLLRDQGAVEMAMITFRPPQQLKGDKLQPIAHQVVWNFGTSLHALIEFHSSRFRHQRTRLSLSDVPDWTYRGGQSDRFDFFCGSVKPSLWNELPASATGWTECVAIAQYGYFISMFRTPIGPEYSMTLNDLEGVLKALDERIVTRLDQK